MSKTQTEIVKIDPKEYGLTDQTASQIRAQFEPMLQKMEALEGKYNEILQMDPIDEATSEAARELRLEYKRIRTATAKIHKEQKAFYLQGGRFVDGWKNAQAFASQGKEQKLQELEEYQERLIEEQKNKIREEREAELAKLEMDHGGIDLAEMPADVWEAYYQAKKKVHDDRIAAEKEAQRKREEEEKRQREEQRKRQEELERLRAEQVKREKEEAKRKAKEARERKAQEAKEKKEREAREKAERELQAKIEAERKAREEAEAKLKAEQEAKRLEEEAAEQRRKEMAKKPIKEQLETWVANTQMGHLSTQVTKDKAGKATAEVISAKFEAFKNWAFKEIENL